MDSGADACFHVGGRLDLWIGKSSRLFQCSHAIETDGLEVDLIITHIVFGLHGRASFITDRERNDFVPIHVVFPGPHEQGICNFTLPHIAENRGGRPRVDATPLTVRVPPDMLAALDKFVDLDAIPSRPEAVRLILKEWLMENQMLPADQEGTRPEDLNASNDD